VKKHPKPLSGFLFSRDQKAIDHFLATLSFGGGAINQVNIHLFIETMPFGGVGFSGIGHYYGKAGFDALTHAKSVLISPPDVAIDHLFPPYTEERSKRSASGLNTKRRVARSFHQRGKYVLAGIKVTDTHLVRDAMDLARSSSELYLFNHVMRSWLFSVLLSEDVKPSPDPELLAVSTVLHDLGLTDRYMAEERSRSMAPTQPARSSRSAVSRPYSCNLSGMRSPFTRPAPSLSTKSPKSQ